jgi:hypothetical protein
MLDFIMNLEILHRAKLLRALFALDLIAVISLMALHMIHEFLVKRKLLLALQALVCLQRAMILRVLDKVMKTLQIARTKVALCPLALERRPVNIQVIQQLPLALMIELTLAALQIVLDLVLVQHPVQLFVHHHYVMIHVLFVVKDLIALVALDDLLVPHELVVHETPLVQELGLTRATLVQLLLRLLLHIQMVVNHVILHAMLVVARHAANVTEQYYVRALLVLVKRLHVLAKELRRFAADYAKGASVGKVNGTVPFHVPQHGLFRLHFLIAKIANIPGFFVRQGADVCAEWSRMKIVLRPLPGLLLALLLHVNAMIIHFVVLHAHLSVPRRIADLTCINFRVVAAMRLLVRVL